MATPTSRIEEHPDLVQMRARYAQAASTPTARGLEALTMLTGLYLAISPWIVGFDGFTRLAVNNLVCGLTLALLGLAFATAYERTYGMSWVPAAIGVWLIVSPWVVSGEVDTTRTVVNNVIIGALAILLSLALLAIGRGGRSKSTEGGGGRRRR
ncbi:SPW repeat protein [Streptomyces megasporus]|uniref:SPW repeat protein n=1 Tax=Streptomyces megasporus TaxID=44060 RepID=UPI0004E1F97D|nr:SPW repeat protein [Streptomyces megasporus]